MGRHGARLLLLALFAASLRASESINGGDGDDGEQVRRISSICKLSVLDIAAASTMRAIGFIVCDACRSMSCTWGTCPALNRTVPRRLRVYLLPWKLLITTCWTRSLMTAGPVVSLHRAWWHFRKIMLGFCLWAEVCRFFYWKKNKVCV